MKYLNAATFVLSMVGFAAMLAAVKTCRESEHLCSRAIVIQQGVESVVADLPAGTAREIWCDGKHRIYAYWEPRDACEADDLLTHRRPKTPPHMKVISEVKDGIATVIDWQHVDDLFGPWMEVRQDSNRWVHREGRKR